MRLLERVEEIGLPGVHVSQTPPFDVGALRTSVVG